MTSLLLEGVQHAQAGRRAESREILLQVVRNEPHNELGWYWLATVAATPTEYEQALNEVLRINPSNQQARDELNAYYARLQASVPFPSASEPQPYAMQPYPEKTKRSTLASSSSRTHIFVYGILGIALIGLSFFVGSLTESVPAFCLANVLTPIIIGFFGARGGISNGAVTTIGRGAVDGGLSSAVTAGAIASMCGCATMFATSLVWEELALTSELGILNFTDIGASYFIFVVLLLTGYFFFGLMGGLFGAYSKGLS